MRIAAALLLLAAAALADDKLHIRTKEIAAPGIPGPLCVYGKNAHVAYAGGAGKGLLAPVIAAGSLGKGRVVAFGHGGYFGKAALKHIGTRVALMNSIRWARRTRSGGIRLHKVPAVRELFGGKEWNGGTEWNGVDELPKDCKVLVMDAGALRNPKTYAAVERFVKSGGGFVTASLGWGWKQLNPGKDLRTDHAGNRLLSQAGIVWADGYLKRTSKAGYAAIKNIPSSLHARGALRKPAKPQAVATLTRCVHAIPGDDRKFLPQLQMAMLGVSFAQKRELTNKDGLARVAFAWQIEYARRVPPKQVRAHPWSRRFPGKASGTPVTRIVAVDMSVPRWTSTGLYAMAGKPITVKVPEGVTSLRVRIGAHSDRLWQKPKWQRAPEVSGSWKLTERETTVASAFGGLVYIEVPKRAKPAVHEVRISGAIEAPLFVLGKTRIEDWPKIRALPGPWAELASDKLIITVPSRVLREMDDPRPVIEFWVRVLDACADLAARPRERASPERFVVDKQISAGYMHSGYPLMAHLDAAAWLPNIETATKGNWGLFHEIGHNHQHRDWTFGGTTEVTVNLFTLYVYETVCKTEHARANLFGDHRKKTIAGYVARGRKFSEWKSKPFLALLMYMQLQEEFGWDAFKAVFDEYGELPHPKNDAEKRDEWMVRFSRHVQKNLGPFFQAWGVPTSTKARESIAYLPEWSGFGVDPLPAGEPERKK